MELTKKANDLYVAKGKKVVHVDLKKDKPGAAKLEALIVGPTGNLRAPSFFVGKTMVVGFHDDIYKEVLK